MLVFNIQHFSTHDGPGIRTVIFLKGCPLRCAWCHNPEGMAFEPEVGYDERRCVRCGACTVCPAGAHRLSDGVHLFDRQRCRGCGRCAEVCPTAALEQLGREYTAEELCREAARDAAFYGTDGGVTVSGGEPFAQFEGLLELLRTLRQAGYSTAVETSGFTTPERLRETAAYTDLFLYDCKLTDTAAHRRYTGVGNEAVLSNLAVLDELGAEAVLRCPIIPGVNDTPEHIRAVGAIADAHPSVRAVEPEPYHPLGLRKYASVGRTAGFTLAEKLPADTLDALRVLLHSVTVKNVI